MFGANVFDSQYGTILLLVSILVGFFCIFILRNSNNFRALLSFQIGSVFLFLYFYLQGNDHILYSFGLNYNYVTFLKMFITLLISSLWINSAAEFYTDKPANREVLTLYISLGAAVCLYNSFIIQSQLLTFQAGKAFIIISIAFLLLSTLSRLKNNFTSGYLLLNGALLILLYKLVISGYFHKYGWLNLNLLNYVWIYVFVAAVIFLRFNLYQKELEKAWISCDKLNLQLHTMIDSSPFPIIISKLTDGRLLMINSRAANTFGITKKEASYHKIKDFFIDEANREEFMKKLETKHEIQDFDLIVCDLINASPFWLSVSAKIIEYNNEMALYMAFQDITSRKEREANLQNRADKDPLTQAWNRRYFENKVPEILKEAIKKSQNFSLLMIDADYFKNINDTYGHKIGDEVLIELVRICRNSLRENDIVARFGGEEFVVYLNDTNTETACIVAERLRSTIENSVLKIDNDTEIRFTVSIGVVSSEKTSSLEILLRQVDDSMYLAKHRGRNQIAVYDEQEIKKLTPKINKESNQKIHPIFQHEENEEFSLLDDYEPKIL